jgi:beta-mannosidase
LGLPDFVRKSQLVNYDCYRAIFEGRNSKLFNPASGVLLWMSNPAQPSFVWQLYSYDLEPNSAEFGTEKACEPVHIQMNPNNWQIQVINNTPKTLARAGATVSVYNVNGKQIENLFQTLNAAPSTTTDVMAIPPPTEFPANIEFVKLQLVDSRGHLLSDNFYWEAADSTTNLTGLNSLPRVGLLVSAERVASGRTTRIAVSLRNPTKAVALMAHLQLRHGKDRVLPVFYSDNYVSLLPGESRRITIECATEDLKGDSPSLVLDGWNVEVADGRGSGDVPVATNEDAYKAR